MARNKYPGRCYCCGMWVEPGYGHGVPVPLREQPKWLISYYLRHGSKVFTRDMLRRWASRIQPKYHELMEHYVLAGEDSTKTALALGCPVDYVEKTVRDFRANMKLVEAGVREGEAKYIWLFDQGLNGYRKATFPTLTGRQFAEIWNCLPRLGRVVILAQRFNWHPASIAQILDMPLYRVKEAYHAAERMLHGVAFPHDMKHALSTCVYHKLRRTGIETREELAEFLEKRGSLRVIPGIGVERERELLFYLGHRGEPVYTTTEFVHAPELLQTLKYGTNLPEGVGFTHVAN